MLAFPSLEFDDAVAAVCHGSASNEQARALNTLLLNNPDARDEYILRLELHSRLASERDLFPWAAAGPVQPLHAGDRNATPHGLVPFPSARRARNRRLVRVFATAAVLALLAAGRWGLRLGSPAEKSGTTSKAVAMLSRVVDAEWKEGGERPRLGAPLEPGWLRLESGLAQVVFYSGARVVLQGPAELELISPSQASCRSGRLTAEVPPQARGFRLGTPRMTVTDLGASFGLNVMDRLTELHVFKGSVEVQAGADSSSRNLREGSAVVREGSSTPRFIAASPAAFASLFELQARSVAAEALRYSHWRAASGHLSCDPALLVHFDLENAGPARWQLPNAGHQRAAWSDGTIVGCQWAGGRWPEKRALEFQSVNDRVRLTVPGEFEALTLATWVCIKGLDRQINSLFMCDGFELGTVHWCIRHDGVLGLTVVGTGSGHHQIVASPPVMTVDKFGLWLHLAVVLDGNARRVAQYVNGVQVGGNALKLKPPFRIGAAEFGNWNPKGFRENDPLLIRNFSGAMDEFCLFSRALDAGEIRALYSAGKPQPDSLAQNRN